MLATVQFILIVLITNVFCEDTKHLYFSYITTVTGGTELKAIGARPLVDLALEEINNRTDILQNYTLKYNVIHDSECERSKSLASFFQDFPHNCPPNDERDQVRPTNFLAILGCGCSIATSSVAEISHFWNVPQISFASSSSILTDRSRFKNLFLTLPSFQGIPTAIVQMFHQFRWRQMAVVSQHDPLFNQISTILKRNFSIMNWTIHETRLPENTVPRTFPYSEAFQWMTQKLDYRIILLNTFGDFAYLILCRAYELGLFPPKYLWITPTWLNEGWWISSGSRLGRFACPSSYVTRMLTGSIGVTPYGLLPNENKTTVSFSKQTTSSLLDEYARRLTLPQYTGLEKVEIAEVAYDAVWSIALGLDIAAKKIQSGNSLAGCEQFDGELVPLDQFNYSNAKMGCILKNSFDEVDFIGITGKVSYAPDGIRSNNLFNVQQLRENDQGQLERITFADITIDSTNSTVHFVFKEGESEFNVWETGTPYDGSVRSHIHENSMAVGSIFYILAGFGMIFTLACLVFNIVFRNKKVVKLSSPNLNYLIIFGAAMLYVCVCLYVLPIGTRNLATIICNIRLWIFSLSYTLCFAVILVKTWRVFYIFTNPTAKKKVVKDWVLIVLILIIMAGDLMMLVIGTVVPDSRLTGKRERDGEDFSLVSSDGANEFHYVYVCFTGDSVIFLSFLFIYKGLLQVIAMFMAFNTRKVKIKALNDSKETAAIIYINSIVLVLMTVSGLLLEPYHHTFAVLFGLALFVQATLFLGMLFIPKAVVLYKDPNSDNVFSVSTDQNNKSGISVKQQFTLRRSSDYDSHFTNTGINGTYNKTIEALREQVKTLEGELGEKHDEEKMEITVD